MSETILVLEDDPMVRKTIVRILHHHGYNVLQAATPEEASQAMRSSQGPVHLLLTDLKLQATSGRTFASEARALYPNLKTLMMSGGSDPGEGAFLSKPFTADILTERIRSVLEG